MHILYAAGRYQCRVIGQEFTEAGTGSKQFVLKIVPTGRYRLDEPDALEQVQEQERRIYRAITDNTISYFLDDLVYLGFEGDSFTELDPSTPGFHDLTGLLIDATCSHETFKGKQSEKWQIYRGSNSSPLDEQGMRDLDALFGPQLRARRKSAPKTDGQARKATLNEEADAIASEGKQEIPF